MTEQRFLFEAPYCTTCVIASICGDRFTARACPDVGLINLTPRSKLHVKHEDFFFHYKRNDRFIYDEIRGERQAIPSLPAYVPILEPCGLDWVAGLPLSAAAVPLKRVVSPRGHGTKRGRALRDKLALPSNCKLVGVSFGQDQLLEDVERLRHERLAEIAGLGFDLVTSLDFSVYDSDWPPERLNNQTRSLMSFKLLQEAGAVVIPHLAWSNNLDIDRLAKWLDLNPAVEMVAFDLQSPGKISDWERYLQTLDYLLTKARPLAYWIHGLADADRIRSVRERLPKMVLSNGYAYVMATKGQELFRGAGPDGKKYAARSDAEKRDIFLNYVCHFERLCLKGEDLYTPVGSPWVPKFQKSFSN